MGPSCKFCDQRCFVHDPTPGSTQILATCTKGQEHDKAKLGYNIADATEYKQPGTETPDRIDIINRLAHQLVADHLQTRFGESAIPARADQADIADTKAIIARANQLMDALTDALAYATAEDDQTPTPRHRPIASAQEYGVRKRDGEAITFDNDAPLHDAIHYFDRMNADAKALGFASAEAQVVQRRRATHVFDWKPVSAEEIAMVRHPQPSDDECPF
ncbi:hypothetical protein D5S18_24955 [Nocardia panacis]|uniref:Uncharacterized protein n=1 Tax=Nocardia panacis TaxID=2340916 RepID=A0A3A4K3W3_9NOCA|nr:hypothetical protein [Nocardia panacis]RJO71423.1 hypothetical protein D5S18_24955 [Nocardia panacis]